MKEEENIDEFESSKILSDKYFLETMDNNFVTVDLSNNLVFEKQENVEKLEILISFEGSPKSLKKILNLIVGIFIKLKIDMKINIKGIQEGSIKVIIEGEYKHIERIFNLIDSGEITNIEGYEIKEVKFHDEKAYINNFSSSKRYKTYINKNFLRFALLVNAEFYNVNLRRVNLT